MQKSISQDTSPLGPLFHYDTDLLGEALAVSLVSASADADKKASSSCFTPQQIENLFWALVDVAGLKTPSLSAARVGEYYLNAYVFLSFLEIQQFKNRPICL